MYWGSSRFPGGHGWPLALRKMLAEFREEPDELRNNATSPAMTIGDARERIVGAPDPASDLRRIHSRLDDFPVDNVRVHCYATSGLRGKDLPTAVGIIPHWFERVKRYFADFF
jgi:hypothetical protein